MVREAVFGNGRMLACLDGSYTIRELYYPHVGEENHIGQGIRLGLYDPGEQGCSWLDQDCENWELEIGYLDATPVGNTVARNTGLGLELVISDFVHYNFTFLGRRLEVHNLRGEEREIRLFQAQDYHILGTSIADTAFYSEKCSAIIHYQKDRYFLHGSEPGFDDFAVGEIDEVRKSLGTWYDAEDGLLSGNRAAHGSVDSVFGISLKLPPEGTREVFLWIIPGRKYQEVRDCDRRVRRDGPGQFLWETRSYWQTWKNGGSPDSGERDDGLEALRHRSLLVCLAHLDHGGAIIASPDTSVLDFNRDHYSYCWPRDAAWICTALQEVGRANLTTGFYWFCADTLTEDGFLLHKYWCSGTLASTWHHFPPFQEDETASVLAALGHFHRSSGLLEPVAALYEVFIKPAARFLVHHRYPDGLPRESWNLWEERWQVSAYTCAAVYRGLKEAARFASAFGEPHHTHLWSEAAEEVKRAVVGELYDDRRERFLNGITRRNEEGRRSEEKDRTLDSSLCGLFAYKMFGADDHRVVNTMEQLEEGLSVGGGIARYQDDYYFRQSEEYPGNPWIITTLFTAWWYIERAETPGDLESAHRYIRWTAERALPSGVLPEQVHPETGAPVGVAPLAWSSAMFLLVLERYNHRLRELEDGNTRTGGVQ